MGRQKPATQEASQSMKRWNNRGLKMATYEVLANNFTHEYQNNKTQTNSSIFDKSAYPTNCPF
jgi:anti-sigma regulatory factor (Ser/Thr protein kinase)